MNSFDPLDLFSPENTDSSSESGTESISFDGRNVSNLIENQVNTNDNDYREDLENDEIIEILDFPHMSQQPPYEFLVFLLSLLAPDPQYNFVNLGVKNKPSDLENPETVLLKYLEERRLTVCKANNFVKWIQDMYDSGRIASRKLGKLANLPRVSQACKSDSVGFFTYTTGIVSSSLSWIKEKRQKEMIWKLASLRLAENCGRTAQPEFIRRIIIDENNSDSIYNVKLKEPSLTEDKLGLKTWGSSLALSSRLVNNYCGNKEKSIKNYLRQPLLELGSGTGLVGIVCGLLEKENKISNNNMNDEKGIYLTDLPEIVDNLKDNVDLNNIADICEVSPLDWKDPVLFNAKMISEYGFEEGNTNVFNTLIFSDPMYSSDHPYLIVNMIKQYLNLENHGNVIIELPARPKYENERKLLWRLIEDDEILGKRLKLLDDELEDGEDDFGKQALIFKNWSS